MQEELGQEGGVGKYRRRSELMMDKSIEGEERKKSRVITILQLPGSSLLCHNSFNL